MGLVGRALLLVIILAVLLPVVVVLAALESTPAVVYEEAFTSGDVERARRLMKSHDPRRLQAGEIRTLSLGATELNLLLRYAAARLVPGSVHLSLQDGRIIAVATVEVPRNPFGRYLNLTAHLDMAAGRPRLTTTRLGPVSIPAALANLAFQGGHHVLWHHDAYRHTLAAINGIRVDRDRLQLVYQWQPELVDQARAVGRGLLLPAGEQPRLLAYQRRLAEVTKDLAGRRVALEALLGPLFRLAENRSLGGNDPAQENRSALTVLALYIQGVDVARLLDAEPAAARPARLIPVLGERQDLAQHFLISAGIAAAGGGSVADAVGLLKELDDSRHGSGFSFTDLAADRAGVRFAELATGPAARARDIQARVATGISGDQLLPDLTGLEEFLAAEAFRRRYQAVDSPAYRRVAEDIEARIDALALYR
ncbi:MAG: hypothetical protein U5S82_11015 [Gammaproteobacteria bacterium]|nr:hypothetical protein [Gammaproteobacteria bacterium]